uniref:Envelope protein n=1 Tax=Small ruminant lentivirus TaxID=254355 RepID=A0A142J2Y9_CAEV|nr:envelope protein [Small ruminant lentivirus]
MAESDSRRKLGKMSRRDMGEPPLRETWEKIITEMEKRQQKEEKQGLLPSSGKSPGWVSIDLLGTKTKAQANKVNPWEPCETHLAKAIWIILWGIQLTLWGMLIYAFLHTGNCVTAEEYITLISDPYGFQPVKDVTSIPVTCVTKNFTQWGCQPEGAYPDPEKEYRNISQSILKQVFRNNWKWNTYHWPLWQLENVIEWAKRNLKEGRHNTTHTREEIDSLLSGKIRGRFCVPYPYALVRCDEWCWYAMKNKTLGKAKIKINCTRARAVSCTEEMPLAAIQKAYWDKADEQSMKFMTIKACNSTGMRCLNITKNPAGCVEGYPIPPGVTLIPEAFKHLRPTDGRYGGVKHTEKSGRVWVRLANLTGWVNGTPPYWADRWNGTQAVNGTRWEGIRMLNHLGYNISSDPEKGICNFTGKITVGNKEFSLRYTPTWNCSQNWTGHPVWHIFRYLDMQEDMSSRCVQRPQRKNVTIDLEGVQGNCSVNDWDGCTCNKSGNYLTNSTSGNVMIIMCRDNKTQVAVWEDNITWHNISDIMNTSCHQDNCTIEKLNRGRNNTGTLGGVENINCTLPHKNETGNYTCKARKGNNETDSLYVAPRKFLVREKEQYSCLSNIGGLDGMLHQQILLQRYQVIKVRAYTYGVIEMPQAYGKEGTKREKRALSLRRRKRGIGLVIVLAIMAIIAAAGASLGVANAIQQSYTRTAVQELANATAAQQQVLEAAYAMVQHVAKGVVRILEAGVARLETIQDRMLLYQELDCWHYQHYCVTSTRSEVAQYVNWTRYKNNCTWQQWEIEIEQHEKNLTLLLQEAALKTQIAARDASRIPDVWTALKQAFDWSGWFAWLKYIPIIIVGIIGCILLRCLLCIITPCFQVYKSLRETRYEKVTVIIESPVNLEEGEKVEDGLSGFGTSDNKNKITKHQRWRAAWQTWKNSPWSKTWWKTPYMSLLPGLVIHQWMEDNGWIGEKHKNKKERVDCQDKLERPTPLEPL